MIASNAKGVAVPSARLEMETSSPSESGGISGGWPGYLIASNQLAQAVCRKLDCFTILLLLTTSLLKIQLDWEKFATIK